MGTFPLVSVITRTKDRAYFLDRVYDSLINQTYRPIEWIIVNDGDISVDEVVSKFENSDDFIIKVKINTNRVTMESATNCGLMVATGKYINILDDDDTQKPSFLEKSIDYLENSKIEDEKGVIVYTDLIYEELDKENNFIYKDTRKFYEPQNITISELCKNNIFTVNSFLYRKDVLEKIGLYNENLSVLGDWEFNLRFISMFNIGIIPKNLSNYHMREGKESNSVKKRELFNKTEALIINSIVRGTGYSEILTKTMKSSWVSKDIYKILNRDLTIIKNQNLDNHKHLIDVFESKITSNQNLVSNQLSSNQKHLLAVFNSKIIHLEHKNAQGVEHIVANLGKYYEIIQNRDDEIKNRDDEIKNRDDEIKFLNNKLNDTITSKQEHIKHLESVVFLKEQHIQNLEVISQQMRLKNRAKNIIKKLLPPFILDILRKFKQKKVSSNYNYEVDIENKDIKKEIKKFNNRPLISIIMPVYNVEPKWLDLAIKSIENQIYTNWELCITDDKSSNNDTIEYLKNLKNPKIRVKYLKNNGNISIASNEALSMTKGEYIALIDNDDELTNDALYEVIKAINENSSEFIYSDEDKLELDGRFTEPHFKPDFAPDQLLSQNYISHLGVIKKELITKVGGFRVGFEGSQDYDLYLRVLEHTSRISHIPKVLYHWRKIPGSTAENFDDKSYAQNAGKKALEEAMQRRGIKSEVLNGKNPGTYRVKYKIIDNPLVSIIIPFKDKPELLKMCLDSILEKSTYQNFEIIGVSNNSREQETFEMMKQFEQRDSRIKFIEYNVEFNFSKINNYAVSKANGEQILLLNNDIEIISNDWIETLLEHSQREGVGCVGAKLYYPNGTIQHAGVILGLGGVAGHSHKHFEKEHKGYFFRLQIVQNLSAVTAACFMIKKSIYDKVNGLNEDDLKIAFNDVDFCLRVAEIGHRNIFTPYCEAYHHESISRGAEDNPEKIERFSREINYMKKRHKTILENGDPYYNINLTLDREDFSIK